MESYPGGIRIIKFLTQLDFFSVGIYIFVYMAHHFILLRLNPFGLRVDREGWWFEHSMT